MKKSLISLSIVLASVMLVSAQVIQVGGTLGGVPIQVGTQNGGTLLIGQTAIQNQVNGGALLQLLALAQTLVARLGIFAVGLAILAFFWFLISWIWRSNDDAEAKKNNLKGMGMSILALFVMVSIWGIVGVLGSITGIGQGGSVPIPGIPTPAQ